MCPVSSPFDFEREMWDLIVFIPAHGLSFYCTLFIMPVALFKKFSGSKFFPYSLMLYIVVKRG